MQVAFSILLPPFFLHFLITNRLQRKKERKYAICFLGHVRRPWSSSKGKPERVAPPPSSLSLSLSCLTRAPFFPVFLDRTRRPFKIFFFLLNKIKHPLAFFPHWEQYTPTTRGAVGGEDLAYTKRPAHYWQWSLYTVYTKCTNVKTGPVVGNILKQLKYIPLVNTMRIEKMCV